MIRVAAVGDVHFGPDSRGNYRPSLSRLSERADVFLIAGDLTRWGDPEEARALAEELHELPVPTFAVLGNHDYQSGREDDVVDVMAACGIRVLDGDGVTVEVGGVRVGIAGTAGFGGGFAGGHATDFGEPETKAFVGRTIRMAGELEGALLDLDADVRIALLHYSPVRETLSGEPPEIHAFLGSYLLAEAIDRAGADLALHGHAHRGTEKGATPRGVHVRNVAWPVIEKAYALYELEPRKARREQLVR
ncbi:MAG TPA: metallophosphoesterase [Actinomycetota bacterium]|nr:metallophosphoesterase [Actinomycetota bacterium]